MLILLSVGINYFHFYQVWPYSVTDNILPDSKFLNFVTCCLCLLNSCGWLIQPLKCQSRLQQTTFINIFFRENKTWCFKRESSARGFTCKIKSYFLRKIKLKCRLLQFLFGAITDNCSFRHYFRLFIGPSPREREKEKRNERREKISIETTPTHTYCKYSRFLHYFYKLQ